MNRNEEWEIFIQEIKNNPPIQGLAFSAENAVARAKRKSKAGLLVSIPVAGVCVAVVALTAVCNMSPRFAQTASGRPLLRGLARMLTANPHLRAITAGNANHA